MDIKDITGLEKPLHKLMEVFSEGSGVLGNHWFGFDAKKIKRVGQAEIQIEKEKMIAIAEAEAQVQNIQQRAENRFMLEQYNKQVNLDNIFVKTRELLKSETVSEDSVDRDWSFKFMNIAQDVSREEMQEVLSKILAGEIKKPGRFSYRTLEIVKNLNKSDITTFRNMSLISTTNIFVLLNQNNASSGFFDFSYSQIMYFAELGLIQPAMDMRLPDVKKTLQIVLKDRSLNLLSEGEKIGDLYIIKFTNPGEELSSLFDIKTDSDKKYLDTYIKELEKYFEKRNIKLIID